MRKILLMFLALALLFNACAARADGSPIRVGVAEFVNRMHHQADYYHSYNNFQKNYLGDNTNYNYKAAKVFTDVLAAASPSGQIEAVSSRSLQNLTGANAEDAASAGKAADCKYVLLGTLSLDDVRFSYKYGGFLGVEINSSRQIQKFVLDTRLIETASGKVVLSASGTGIGVQTTYFERPSKNKDNKNKDKKQQKSSASQYAEESEKAMEEAVKSASSIVSEKICAFLTGEYPQVSLIKDLKSSSSKKFNTSRSFKVNSSKQKGGKKILGSVKIDRGTSSGVKQGVFYRIYFDGENISDLAGNSLGSEKNNIAIAEVAEARTNSCTANIIAGNFKNIRGGDKAEQISPEDAAFIIEENNFAQNRLSEFLKF